MKSRKKLSIVLNMIMNIKTERLPSEYYKHSMFRRDTTILRTTLNFYSLPAQLGFQEPATPVMEGIIDFHHDLMFFLIYILGFVVWFLVIIGYSFYNRFPSTRDLNMQIYKRHINFIRVPSKQNHHLWLEIVWTVIPALILISIVLPSFALIYSMDEFLLRPRVTLKAIGNQWYWTYNYGCNLSVGATGATLEEILAAEPEIDDVILRTASSAYTARIADTRREIFRLRLQSYFNELGICFPVKILDKGLVTENNSNSIDSEQTIYEKLCEEKLCEGKRRRLVSQFENRLKEIFAKTAHNNTLVEKSPKAYNECENLSKILSSFMEQYAPPSPEDLVCFGIREHIISMIQADLLETLETATVLDIYKMEYYNKATEATLNFVAKDMENFYSLDSDRFKSSVIVHILRHLDDLCRHCDEAELRAIDNVLQPDGLQGYIIEFATKAAIEQCLNAQENEYLDRAQHALDNCYPAIKFIADNILGINNPDNSKPAFDQNFTSMAPDEVKARMKYFDMCVRSILHNKFGVSTFAAAIRNVHAASSSLEHYFFLEMGHRAYTEGSSNPHPLYAYLLSEVLTENAYATMPKMYRDYGLAFKIAKGAHIYEPKPKLLERAISCLELFKVLKQLVNNPKVTTNVEFSVQSTLSNSEIRRISAVDLSVAAASDPHFTLENRILARAFPGNELTTVVENLLAFYQHMVTDDIAFEKTLSSYESFENFLKRRFVSSSEFSSDVCFYTELWLCNQLGYLNRLETRANVHIGSYIDWLNYYDFVNLRFKNEILNNLQDHCLDLDVLSLLFVNSIGCDKINLEEAMILFQSAELLAVTERDSPIYFGPDFMLDMMTNVSEEFNHICAFYILMSAVYYDSGNNLIDLQRFMTYYELLQHDYHMLANGSAEESTDSNSVTFNLPPVFKQLVVDALDICHDYDKARKSFKAGNSADSNNCFACSIAHHMQPHVSQHHFALKFDSYMLPTDMLTMGQLRLLEVDKRVLLPTRTGIRLLVSSYDVLHSWAVPAFGIKLDGCPGRLNQTFMYIKKEGLYYGQCSEICGVNHAFMPIVIKAITPEEFSFWLLRRIEIFNALTESAGVKRKQGSEVLSDEDISSEELTKLHKWIINKVAEDTIARDNETCGTVTIDKLLGELGDEKFEEIVIRITSELVIEHVTRELKRYLRLLLFSDDCKRDRIDKNETFLND